MPKRKNIFIMPGLFLVLLLVLLTAIRCYQLYQENALKRQELVVARQHLLCEVLEPGMSKDEVLNVLKQAGEFTFNEDADSLGSPILLDISFTDPKGRDLYGGFVLGFSDYKYDKAYERVFDISETICDFTGNP
jgi:hypothetical protein